jgi:uncharacterized membrane protein YhaH (DUF805 family)
MKHFLNAFENYANFSGRASVSQYWTFYIISFLIGFIPGINIIYFLASIIPSLSILVRRLHDTEHSGAYIFLILIPIVGWIWLLILLLKEGDVSINKYGKPISSSNVSISSKHEEVFGHDFTSKSDSENKTSSKPKVYPNAPKEAFNTNKESISEQIDGIKVSDGTSKLTEIEKIERQYEKGIFTEQEKNDLINTIFKDKQNENLEKIKENYNSVLDAYRDKFLEIYSIEYLELEDLHNQGIIDEKTLESKLEILRINIAKRIQKEIKFRSMKGFEVYQGLEVKHGNEVGVIVEIINSQEIRTQLNWNDTLSSKWSIIDITPTGNVFTSFKDFDLDKNNFLLNSETGCKSLNNLKLGDSYNEGEVFFISDKEVKILKDTYIKSDYISLRSKEDNFWKIPDVESVKKCVKYLINKRKFVPKIPELIWTSEELDSSTTKCVQVIHDDNDNEPTTIMCSNKRHQFGILVQTIKKN